LLPAGFPRALLPYCSWVEPYVTQNSRTRMSQGQGSDYDSCLYLGYFPFTVVANAASSFRKK
jgi:hypothetical protein